jgi:hypothetical protein
VVERHFLEQPERRAQLLVEGRLRVVVQDQPGQLVVREG